MDESAPESPTLSAAAIPKTVEIPARKVQEIMAEVSPEVRQQLARFLVEQRVSAQSHRGPLPRPEDLESYCKIIPNGGERIMALYEKQVDHRLSIEKETISSQTAQSAVGQWMGFILGVIGLAIGGGCIYSGHDAAGTALGGATPIGLVSVFVAGKTEIFKSLLEKRPQLEAHDENEKKRLEAERRLEIE